MTRNRHGLRVRRLIKTPAYRILHICDPHGENGSVGRWAVQRPDAVAVLIHNTDRDTLIMTRQRRLPLYARPSIHLLEIPAGVIDRGEMPEDTVRREAEEETGFRPTALMPIARVFTSPGYTTEQMYLYYAAVTDSDKVSAGGGMEEESEYIDIIEESVDYWFDQMDEGRIYDAKTLIALQWMALNSEEEEYEVEGEM